MLIDFDDMTLHYDLHGAGEPLLWLHGTLGHGPDWRYIFPDPPSGYQVIAPDLRGHGRSTGAAATYSFRQSAMDVFALLDHLGIDGVKVIGLSGGGITAMHMATLQPSRVSSMVLVSAPAAFPEQTKAIQRLFSAAALAPAELEMMRQRHGRVGQLEKLLEQVRAMPDGSDPDFSEAELNAVAADTLIVFGDRDPLYPVSLAVDLRRAIRRSWLWVVPNGGHGPVFGPAAPAFVATALAFLGGEWSGAAWFAGVGLPIRLQSHLSLLVRLKPDATFDCRCWSVPLSSPGPAEVATTVDGGYSCSGCVRAHDFESGNARPRQLTPARHGGGCLVFRGRLRPRFMPRALSFAARPTRPLR